MLLRLVFLWHAPQESHEIPGPDVLKPLRRHRPFLQGAAWPLLVFTGGTPSTQPQASAGSTGPIARENSVKPSSAPAEVVRRQPSPNVIARSESTNRRRNTSRQRSWRNSKSRSRHQPASKRRSRSRSRGTRYLSRSYRRSHSPQRRRSRSRGARSQDERLRGSRRRSHSVERSRGRSKSPRRRVYSPRGTRFWSGMRRFLQ